MSSWVREEGRRACTYKYVHINYVLYKVRIFFGQYAKIAIFNGMQGKPFSTVYEDDHFHWYARITIFNSMQG